MKKLAFFTSSKLMQTRWENYLFKYEKKVINKEDELDSLSQTLLLLSTCANIKNEQATVKKLLANGNKILVLDSSPELKTAQKWLSYGANGYGNSFMSSSYLNSAIETINDGLIWLVPEVSTQLIKAFTQTISSSNDEILKDLTKMENQIALLLKDGLSNTKIADKLDISINTVKTHIKSIYIKLGVNDRVSFINLFANS